MSNVLGILVSCLYCKWSLEMMDEHQLNWKEMANIMMKINKKAEKMFNIVVMDYVSNFLPVLLSFICRF